MARTMTIAAWNWRGEAVPAEQLLARYSLRIEPGNGPWRVVALRERHGRPLLQARFVGEGGGVRWRSVGGLTVESVSRAGAAELPVNNDSAYDPRRSEGPWRAEPLGGGEVVCGLGIAVGLPDGPPPEQDNRYQTVEVTWERALPAPPPAPPASGLLLGWELPNRPQVTAEEWQRFDALGAQIAKVRPYHLLDAQEGAGTLRELAWRQVRLALRSDVDGDLERDEAGCVQRLIAAARLAQAAGIPLPVYLIPDSEPNLHGRPVPAGYFERLEQVRTTLRAELGPAGRLVSPPLAVAQGEESWHQAGQAVFRRFDCLGVHAYGQGDAGLVLRFFQFDCGLPFFVAELGESSDGISGMERAARTAAWVRLLAADRRVEACCLFILGTTDPRWERFVLPTAGLPPIRTAARPQRRREDRAQKEQPMIPEEIRHLISRLAERYGVDPSIIAAMCWWESSFRPDAIGDEGHSVGLLQLHDQGLGAGMSVEERKDPARNLEVGIRAHRAYRDEFGSVEAAIAAHNAGGPALRQVGGDWQRLANGRIAETYVQPILAKAEEYRAAGLFSPNPVRVQLDAIWGVSEALLREGRNGQAWQLRAAVIALKDALGLG
ncbi:MAG: hypothetical protein KatS3mg061_0111 [Dehalococcoidia bacterium]|nr:MAG: hypothetical protein KatS3mg061_0111 [Dehalococcoidia bacterium]